MSAESAYVYCSTDQIGNLSQKLYTKVAAAERVSKTFRKGLMLVKEENF